MKELTMTHEELQRLWEAARRNPQPGMYLEFKRKGEEDSYRVRTNYPWVQ